MLLLMLYRVARAADGRPFAYGYDRVTASVCIVELRAFDAAALTGSAEEGSAVTLEDAAARV